MNFALSEEQEFLQEAARGTLVARQDRRGRARRARGRARCPTCGRAACEAGWPGLLIAEEHGGAGLGVMDAMLVFAELGRVLAAVPLLGHLPATLLAARRRTCWRRWRPASAAPSTCPRARRRTSTTAGRSSRERGSVRAASAGTRGRSGSPTRPGPTCSSRSTADGSVVVDRGLRRRAGDALRRDAPDGPRALARRRREHGRRRRERLVPRAGAARRRVARRRRARARGLGRSTPRSASPSAARSAPTRR